VTTTNFRHNSLQLEIQYFKASIVKAQAYYFPPPLLYFMVNYSLKQVFIKMCTR